MLTLWEYGESHNLGVPIGSVKLGLGFIHHKTKIPLSLFVTFASDEYQNSSSNQTDDSARKTYTSTQHQWHKLPAAGTAATRGPETKGSLAAGPRLRGGLAACRTISPFPYSENKEVNFVHLQYKIQNVYIIKYG
jgi:hypothetical protein